MTYTDLSAEELDSIMRYVRDNGTQWRLRLHAAWSCGNALDAYPGLYRLRNTHGPAWLGTFGGAEPDQEEEREVRARMAEHDSARRSFPNV